MKILSVRTIFASMEFVKMHVMRTGNVQLIKCKRILGLISSMHALNTR